MNWTDHFKQRLLFGTSQAFVKQLESLNQNKLDKIGQINENNVKTNKLSYFTSSNEQTNEQNLVQSSCSSIDTIFSPTSISNDVCDDLIINFDIIKQKKDKKNKQNITLYVIHKLL